MLSVLFVSSVIWWSGSKGEIKQIHSNSSPFDHRYDDGSFFKGPFNLDLTRSYLFVLKLRSC